MYDILTAAITALADRCDGAYSQDNVGYNKRDSKFGMSLAEQIRKGYTLTDNQQFAAIKMLQIYRNQLARYGITLPTVTAYSNVAPPQPTTHRAETPGRAQPRPQGVTKVTISAHKGAYCVKFPYNPELVALVKTLSRRSFDPELKAWIVPADCDDELVLKLSGYQAEWTESARELAAQLAKVRVASLLVEANLSIPNLHPVGTLMPFQMAGVSFIDTAGGRALIGDEMGLGKTIQAIGYLALHPELRPAIIVCPASLKPNWRREIEKWLAVGNQVEVINGTKATRLPDVDILIINFDIVKNWSTRLQELDPQILIVDEGHYLKSPKAQRTKAVKELASVCRKVIMLTGTPILNRPAELWPLLNMIQPTTWGNWFAFAKRYCNARQVQMGSKKFWDFSGHSNLQELNDKLKGIMIRRLKKNVLQELPDKRRVVVPIPINLDAYHAFMHDTLEALEEAGNRAAQLVLIEKAKQYVVEEKMALVCDWIDNFLDTEEKLILFATHRATIAEVMEKYREQTYAVQITGESSQDQRDQAVQRFQTLDLCRLFVGNMQAAGVGLTLTASSNVAFLELGWRSGDQTQAEDRAHRIGQKNAVTAWYLLAEGTIEEDIFELLEKKRLIVETVTDGTPSDLGFSADSVAEDLIDLLLKQHQANKRKEPQPA